jgi:Ran GTPase-activating protein (RanGAP) involved in mRNA processing and transport
LNELTLCGITLESKGPALATLSQLLCTRTWKRINFLSCQKGGCLLALSESAATNVPIIRAICIKGCTLQQSDTLSIQQQLKWNPELTHLEISEVDLTQTNSDTNIILPLAKGVASSQSLKVLELSYCTLDADAIACLAVDGLKHNQSLVSLNIPGCELEDDAVATLVNEGLLSHHHTTLRSLKLFRNHCGPRGAKALAKLLDDSSFSITDKRTRLESLDLSYQQFERSEKLNVKLLATTLSRNTSLKHLTLSFNKLNDMDAECLAEALKNNKTLLEIDLRANNIRDKGTVALARGVVSHSPTLQKFCLYGNPLGREGAESLLDAIRLNSEIQIMNMDYNLSVYDEIQYYVYLNQVGRRLLKEDKINPAVWILILERAKRLSLETRGVCSAADLIFPFVRDPALFNEIR